jgi:hypothetical protein
MKHFGLRLDPGEQSQIPAAYQADVSRSQRVCRWQQQLDESLDSETQVYVLIAFN